MTGLFEDDNKETLPTPEHLVKPDEISAEAYYDKLVGEGKKFKDPEALARAKVESDNFIQRLQEENAGLRQDLGKSTTLEQFMEKMKLERELADKPSASNEGTPNPSERDEPTKENPAPSLTVEEVYAEMEKRFEQKQNRSQQEINVKTVHEEAQKAYGPQYKVELTKRAKALEISTDDLQTMAATQPKAFLKLMVEDAKPPSDIVPPPASDINSDSAPVVPTGMTKQSDFDKVRVEDPKRYWSPQFQNQMHNVAMKMGESFFDK